ncbi:MAG TPA: hypothetical protein VK680_03990 [Solirubrobacteraceae bacterium]|jgi:hypothetical protein|nr:hypothetical protein [Solirubrobacteraceae bacterium]
MAGGLAVASGVALWQLGIEFERAWLRSDEGPLLGEALAEPTGLAGETSQPTGDEHSTEAPDGRRRWVAAHHPRSSPQTRNGTSLGSS